jgi:hypothetical protein
MPERDVAAVFAFPSGQQRVNELFRRAQRMRVSRTVVATVAMQDEYMKRVRDGGGARDQLRAEGIVIFGDYAGDQVLASASGCPAPGPGEFVSARLTRRCPSGGVPGVSSGVPAAAGSVLGAAGGREPGRDTRYIRLDGSDWVLARPGDPLGPAPSLPR